MKTWGMGSTTLSTRSERKVSSSPGSSPREGSPRSPGLSPAVTSSGSGESVLRTVASSGLRMGRRAAANEALANGKGPSGRAERWTDYQTAWDYVTHPEGQGCTIVKIFDHVEVAQDGGLSEIGQKPELWYHTRPLTALMMLAFFFLNPVYLIRSDVNILVGGIDKHVDEHHWSGNYLMTTQFLFFASAGNLDLSGWSVQVVLAIELAMLAVLVIRIVYYVYCVVFTHHFKRWHAFARLFFDSFVTMTSFSGMKILFYVAPQVLSRDFCYAVFYNETNRKKRVVWLVISRFFCLVIGMDTFLVKYRMVIRYVEKDTVALEDIVYTLLFLNQVLNAIELTWVIRERLFRFVFGGEDGIMTVREVIRKEIWNARVAQMIMQQYPHWQALSIMATWCDDDFQLLTLNEPGVNSGPERPETLWEQPLPEETLREKIAGSDDDDCIHVLQV